ncbi:MAG: response regulator transcription factor [Anaerolineae bacterium]
MAQIRSLLVDDYNPLRQTVAKVLSCQNDFQVVGEAEDGFEAIEKARALRPDLVLMDMSMPRCDGLEATRRIIQELPGATIILFTSSPTDERVTQALATGAYGCLDKTLGVKQMVQSLCKMLLPNG